MYGQGMREIEFLTLAASCSIFTDILWKSRKAESGIIGTGIGTGSETRTGYANGTGTVM